MSWTLASPFRRTAGAGPALPSRWRRVPFYPQQSVVDCGVACLRMVLAYFGRPVEAAELRRAFGLGRDGVSASAIMKVAKSYGLDVTAGMRLEPEEVLSSRVPVILHWDFKHFVILERVRHRDRIRIVDPARGRRWITSAELSRHFTGVALFCRPGPDFVRTKSQRTLLSTCVPLLVRHRHILLVLLATSLALQLLALAGAKSMQVIIDRVIPYRETGTIGLLIAGMALVAVVQACILYVRATVLIYLRNSMDVEMSFHFYQHLLRLPLTFFDQRSTGDLLMRLSGTATLRELISTRVVATVLDGTVVIGLACVIAVVSPALGLLVGCLAAVRIGNMLALQVTRRDLIAENLGAQAQTQSVTVETLAAILSVKASGAEDKAFERWRRSFQTSLEGTVLLARQGTKADISSAIVNMLSPICVLCFCAYEVLQQRFTLGAIFGLATLAGQFTNALTSVATTWDAWQQAARHIERTREVLEYPAEQSTDMPEAPRLLGKIALQNASFRYSPNAPWALHDVNLTIAPHSFVAIVGESGSGKSTLAKLLLALYEPTTGSITFDDASPWDYHLPSFRRQIGSVVQEGHVVSGSIRSYISGAESSTPLADVIAAAKLAEIHNEIMRMPMAYETILSEGGTNVSGGQRQRLAIARALVATPPVVIFDEATSALDGPIEARVFENLYRLRMTRIVIAHRLSTTWKADKIIVLNRGCVVEAGTHDDLLEQGGYYATLIAAQRMHASSIRPATVRLER